MSRVPTRKLQITPNVNMGVIVARTHPDRSQVRSAIMREINEQRRMASKPLVWHVLDSNSLGDQYAIQLLQEEGQAVKVHKPTDEDIDWEWEARNMVSLCDKTHFFMLDGHFGTTFQVLTSLQHYPDKRWSLHITH